MDDTSWGGAGYMHDLKASPYALFISCKSTHAHACHIHTELES